MKLDLSLALLLLSSITSALPLSGSSAVSARDELHSLSRRGFPIVKGLEKITADMPEDKLIPALEKNGGLWHDELDVTKHIHPEPPKDFAKFKNSYDITDGTKNLGDLHSTINDNTAKALGHSLTDSFSSVDLKPKGVEDAKIAYTQALDKDGKTLLNIHSYSNLDKGGKAQMPWEDIQSYVAGRHSAGNKDPSDADMSASAKKIEQLANINIANQNSMKAIDKVYTDQKWKKIVPGFNTLDSSNPAHAASIKQITGTDNGKLGVKLLGTNMKYLESKDVDQILLSRNPYHMIAKFK